MELLRGLTSKDVLPTYSVITGEEDVIHNYDKHFIKECKDTARFGLHALEEG